MRSALTATLIVALSACTAEHVPNPPARLLGNPVLDARAALAAGDSTYLGLLDPELELPGVDPAEAQLASSQTIRVFSRRSLALPAREWSRQRDSLRVYAAAYNLLVREARARANRRAT